MQGPETELGPNHVAGYGLRRKPRPLHGERDFPRSWGTDDQIASVEVVSWNIRRLSMVRMRTSIRSWDFTLDQVAENRRHP